MAPVTDRSSLPSLLLLPAPPQPQISRARLNAAYRPSLETALAKVKDDTKSTTLIIAVATSLLSGDSFSKTLPWSDAQSLLAGLYTIISVVCAKLSIRTEINGGPGSVDARVVLLHHERGKEFVDFQPVIETNSTIVVDLPSFASAYHPWNYIFHVESPSGLQLHASYLKFAEGVQKLLNDQLVPVDGGLTMHEADEPGVTTMEIQTQGHRVLALGGTFDYLHPGHKLLLAASAILLKVPEPGSTTPCHLIVGVTGDSLLRSKKFAEYVQPWAERARGVLSFMWTLLELSREGWGDRTGPNIAEHDGDFRASFRGGLITVQCVRIEDPFGPTITRKEITALVVSAETRAGGKAVNDKRAELGWGLLEVFEVDVLDADEIVEEKELKDGFEGKISSTVIREQRAKREGTKLMHIIH